MPNHRKKRAWVASAAALLSAQSLDLSAQQSQALEPLDSSGRVTYFIGEGTRRSRYRASDGELARWALEAWERGAAGAFRLEPGAETTALLRVYFVPASYGQYGEMRATLVDGHRGAAVFVRPDTEALDAKIAALAQDDSLWRDIVVYLTCLHELGHALGLRHTADFDDIMYSFQFGGDIPAFFGRYREQVATRDDIAHLMGFSPGDLAQLEKLYAREREP
jgi:hypothetical protein